MANLGGDGGRDLKDALQVRDWRRRGLVVKSVGGEAMRGGT